MDRITEPPTGPTDHGFSDGRPIVRSLCCSYRRLKFASTTVDVRRPALDRLLEERERPRGFFRLRTPQVRAKGSAGSRPLPMSCVCVDRWLSRRVVDAAMACRRGGIELGRPPACLSSAYDPRTTVVVLPHDAGLYRDHEVLVRPDVHFVPDLAVVRAVISVICSCRNSTCIPSYCHTRPSPRAGSSRIAARTCDQMPSAPTVYSGNYILVFELDIHGPVMLRPQLGDRSCTRTPPPF